MRTVPPLGATLQPTSSIRVASDELLDLFNQQVTNELEASQLYLAASIWFDQRDLTGFSKYMLAESNDERSHALQFIEFSNKRNIPLKLESIQAPDVSSWNTPEQVWEALLDAEKENTLALLEVADAAVNCQDHAVNTFLMPFHMEQVDSEDKLGTILAKVRDENKTPGLLRQLDSELGTGVSS